MKTEARPEIIGVGAFIVNPDIPSKGFIALQELITKRSTNKLAGMFSYPVETIEPGEDHNQALLRLFKEEIHIQPPLILPKIKLGQFLLLPGVSLHTYLFEVKSDVTIAVGSTPQEVKNPRWMTFQEVLAAPLGRFRAGVYETVTEYLTYLQDPDNFHINTYVRLRDWISEEVFNLMEAGCTKAEFLYRQTLLG